MPRLLAALAALGAILAVVTGTAGAVQYGQPDDGEHPYVGLVMFYDGDDKPVWSCSGALVSPTVLLTAAHCAEAPAASARVWFDEQVTPAVGYPFSGGTTGIPVPHTSWPGPLPATHDTGVVVLDAAVTGRGYGSLAPEGYLDELAADRKADTSFEIVGYGLQSVKPTVSDLTDRRKGTVQLVNLRSALTDGYNLQTTNSPGQGVGPGGACFGDSGGPVLHEGTIVAVTSFFLNRNCKGTTFSYRVDTADARGFLDDYLTLP